MKKYKLLKESLVKVSVDLTGRGHTFIGNVDVSDVTRGVTLVTDVNDITKITVRMIAMPLEIKAFGVVEIIDNELPIKDDYTIYDEVQPQSVRHDG